MKAYELAAENKGMREEIERLRHDVERHIAMASELATENEALRADLAEARTVKESLIVSLDLLGRHSPKGKPCPVCEAIDAAMAGGER
jgi:regulator of replication initiation timing